MPGILAPHPGGARANGRLVAMDDAEAEADADADADADAEGRIARIRREPPRFRIVTTQHVEALSPRLVRITLAGDDLAGFAVDEPAASVRLLLPPSPGADLVVPDWNGNEFLMADGRRPTIRTFTPRHVDRERLTLDIEAVIHGDGPASRWAAAAAAGDRAAVSGPGRGYAIDTAAPAFLLAGDESAVPAISQLLEALPPETPTQVHVEAGSPEARIELPARPNTTVEWHDLEPGAPPGATLVAAVRAAVLPERVQIWGAGEAAAMQRIRRHLFDERGVARAQTTIRGYWKHGRAGDDEK
jgi:NADPH-dependent ferric siderophore reductase